MPRYRRDPLTLDALALEGPPVRLRDLIALSGLCSATIRADIARGELTAHQRLEKPNAPYFVHRLEACRWLRQIGVVCHVKQIARSA